MDARCAGRIWTSLCIVWLVFVRMICAWDSAELEVFDVVEEVNQNFYEFLGVTSTAGSSDIRKAYRRLSLQLHPDKNKEDDAEEKFRKLVAIYEIMKDEEKRRIYDDVLQNGLPTWRQPVYYYRRVRKMSLLELCLFLFVLLTGGQYILAWSVYIERKFELEEVLTSKFKKKDRKTKKYKQQDTRCEDLVMAHIQDQLTKPSYQDLLPFQFCRLVVFLIKSAPHCYQLWRELWAHLLSRFSPAEEKDETDDEDDESGDEHVRKPRRRKLFELPDMSSGCLLESMDGPDSDEPHNQFSAPYTKATYDKVDSDKCGKEPWTEEDLLGLTRAIKKFPGGVTDRWEKIATLVGKPVAEVLVHAKKLKSSRLNTVSASMQGITGSLSEQVPVKVKKCATNELEVSLRDPADDTSDETTVKANSSETQKTNRRAAKPKDVQRTLLIMEQPSLPAKTDAENISSENISSKPNPCSDTLDDTWGQTQQRALELAMTQFPKGTEERWDRIAACVPEKTKEECLHRYKQLVELVKKKRQAVPR